MMSSRFARESSPCLSGVYSAVLFAPPRLAPCCYAWLGGSVWNLPAWVAAPFPVDYDLVSEGMAIRGEMACEAAENRSHEFPRGYIASSQTPENVNIQYTAEETSVPWEHYFTSCTRRHGDFSRPRLMAISACPRASFTSEPTVLSMAYERQEKEEAHQGEVSEILAEFEEENEEEGPMTDVDVSNSVGDSPGPHDFAMPTSPSTSYVSPSMLPLEDLMGGQTSNSLIPSDDFSASQPDCHFSDFFPSSSPRAIHRLTTHRDSSPSNYFFPNSNTNNSQTIGDTETDLHWNKATNDQSHYYCCSRTFSLHPDDPTDDDNDILYSHGHCQVKKPEEPAVCAEWNSENDACVSDERTDVTFFPPVHGTKYVSPSQIPPPHTSSDVRLFHSTTAKSCDAFPLESQSVRSALEAGSRHIAGPVVLNNQLTLEKMAQYDAKTCHNENQGVYTPENHLHSSAHATNLEDTEHIQATLQSGKGVSNQFLMSDFPHQKLTCQRTGSQNSVETNKCKKTNYIHSLLHPPKKKKVPTATLR